MLDAVLKGVLSRASLEHRPPPPGTKHERSIPTPQQIGADIFFHTTPAVIFEPKATDEAVNAEEQGGKSSRVELPTMQPC